MDNRAMSNKNNHAIEPTSDSEAKVWLSVEHAADIESDAALHDLLAPVHRWLNVLSVRNHSPHTLTAYFAGLNQLALFLRGKRLTWTRCDKRQLAQHISQRLDEDKLALASVQQELSAIRHFYGWLIEEDLARINPTTGYQLKRSPRPLPSIAMLICSLSCLTKRCLIHPNKRAYGSVIRRCLNCYTAAVCA